MVTKLIGRTGPVAGLNVVIAEDCSVMRIGASPASEIRITADGVSREHARIVRRPDGCWIEDAGSANGTFVNGLRLKSEKLRHLDVVTLARRVDLIFLQSDKETGAANAPAVLAVSLEFLNGPEAGKSVDIPAGETTIGRTPVCNVMVSNQSVGKTHARLTRTGGQVTIEDLKSANGTFVNDARISLAVLTHGDRISLAGVAHFRVQLRAELGAGMPAEISAETRVEPAYSTAWQTRYVWSPTELDAIANNDARVLDLMDQAPEAASPGRKALEVASPERARRAEPAPAPGIQLDDTLKKRVTSVYAPPPANPPNLANLANLKNPANPKAIELTGGPEGPVTLRDGVHTIGRQATATVRLAEGDREGSRIHAALTIAGARVTIEDRSANGTFVNDERVKEPRALRDGDKVRCGGSTFTVRFVR